MVAGQGSLSPTYGGRTRLRFSTCRGLRPLDDAALAQVLDLLIVVPELPQEGLGVLAGLGGGAVESRRQGGLDQPAVTGVCGDERIPHLNAQRTGLRVALR